MGNGRWYVELLALVTRGSPVGIVLLIVAIAALFYWVVRTWGGPRWLAVIAAYIMPGLSVVATPLAIVVPGTNGLGIVFLTIIWPFWLFGGWLGWEVLEFVPDAVLRAFFV